MSFMNQSRLSKYQCAMVIYLFTEGVNKQFKQGTDYDSVLAYMAKYQGQKEYMYIFRNFLEMFHQVFDGLDYLRKQKLVHRDVKGMYDY